MSWISCRKSAVIPEPSLPERAARASPFRHLVPSASSVDRTDDAGLAQAAFRACGPYAAFAGGPAVALARLALRPKVSRECGQGKQVRPNVERWLSGLELAPGVGQFGLGKQVRPNFEQRPCGREVRPPGQ